MIASSRHIARSARAPFGVRALSALCACVLAVSLSFALVPATAFAGVAKTDVVAGETVESRGLAVSQCPSIDATYAYVVDGNGTVYFERNSDKQTHIASVTKIMTAIVALENSQLTDQVTVSAEAASIGESSASLKEGDVLSMEDAIKALKKHYHKKPLLPSTFSKANHLQEIKGVYVPFWMYDGEASGSVEFHATTVHKYTSGDYEITETSHYDVRRAGSIAFEKIPVDASSKMPDDYMDSIEPYDYAELRPFSTAYLPGFLADKYDVSVEDSRERADTRCAGSLLSALERTVSGYTTCNETSRDIHLKRGKVHYALLPVWILNTRWEGKDFLFAMNGQTGKLVGNLPVSTKRVIGLFAAIAAPLIAISVTALLLMAR